MFIVRAFAPLLVALGAKATPVVNVQLSPAAVSLPEVAAEIASLDAERSKIEAAGFKRLDAAYASACADADRRIKGTLSVALSSAARPSSLLATASEQQDGEEGFQLRVLPVAPPSNRVQKKIASVERVRTSEELALIDQAVKEMGLLVDIVLAQLQAELGASMHVAHAASFLASRVAQGGIDIRLLPPTETFASIAGLVAKMENRRDVAEDKLRQHIVELEVKLLRHMQGAAMSAFK